MALTEKASIAMVGHGISIKDHNFSMLYHGKKIENV